MPFDHTKIEPKWQKYWDENKTFKTDCYDDSKPKYYCMDMFPYPSGNGLHVGHPEGYTATDIVSRMKRMQGYNVLHPMGFDSFGLPAEQFAIQTGHHPAEFTKKNIDVFRKQIKSLGFSYDWDREIATSDPEYYKWTQWIFTKLYDQGLAYIDEIPVNWCPELKAVLANEDADQETVSAAATAILNELSKAVKNADLSSLESLIKSAKKLQDGNYTSNSLAKLDEVIKAAEAVVRTEPLKK